MIMFSIKVSEFNKLVPNKKMSKIRSEGLRDQMIRKCLDGFVNKATSNNYLCKY